MSSPKPQEKLNYNIVETLGMKFVVSSTPNPDNLPRWIELWQKEGVKHVARACEPTYSNEPLEQVGITLHVCRSLLFALCTCLPRAHLHLFFFHTHTAPRPTNQTAPRVCGRDSAAR